MSGCTGAFLICYSPCIALRPVQRSSTFASDCPVVNPFSRMRRLPPHLLGETASRHHVATFRYDGRQLSAYSPGGTRPSSGLGLVGEHETVERQAILLQEFGSRAVAGLSGAQREAKWEAAGTD